MKENKINLGYDARRLANLEEIRNNSEIRKIVREAEREKSIGSRNWNPKINDKIQNLSYFRAENEIFNAPIGTVITMQRHNTGDYIGEYTRTKDGWVGSQKYKSSFRNPPTVNTAEGFAMHTVGNDIKVLKIGK